MLQSVAFAVASDDAPCLPEADVVQELVTADSDFAYEQLINVAGG